MTNDYSIEKDIHVFISFINVKNSLIANLEKNKIKHYNI